MTIFKVRTLWSGGPGGAGVSTMYWSTSAGTASQANDAMGAFWDAVASVIGGGWNAQTDSVVYEVDEADGQITGAVAVTPETTAYADGNDPLPGLTQGLLQLRTGVYVAGRELRGRLFIPGPTENENTAGRPKASYLSAVNTAATNELINALDAAPVVWSRAHGAFWPVVAATCWTEWAVLRSRRS